MDKRSWYGGIPRLPDTAKSKSRVGGIRARQLAIFVLMTSFSITAQDRTWRQTQADEYTRYELLGPDTQSFRILYDVTATAAGASHYYNGLRAGSEHKVDTVYDLMSGKPLEWAIVEGQEGRAQGISNLQAEGEYLRVKLARPVPEGGEARIRIDKTYRDTKSYFQEKDTIVFSRSLGIKKNAVVLPKGYELISCNYPSQVVTEDDGRVRVSFMNRGQGPVDFRVSARPLQAPLGKPKPNPPAPSQQPAAQATSGSARPGARIDYTFPERAFQDREIVYFLQQPETSSFRLYHDYTETREGIDRYLNIVRSGSKASNPSARNLDTGQQLKVETLVGRKQIEQRGIKIPGADADTEVVAIWFDPVEKGQSVRIRIEETYTDPGRYLLVGSELIWDRSFGRSRNAVLLPQGWYLTTSSIPAVTSEEDGKIRLDFINDRPGNIDVFIKAVRR